MEPARSHGQLVRYQCFVKPLGCQSRWTRYPLVSGNERFNVASMYSIHVGFGWLYQMMYGQDWVVVEGHAHTIVFVTRSNLTTSLKDMQGHIVHLRRCRLLDCRINFNMSSYIKRSCSFLFISPSPSLTQILCRQTWQTFWAPVSHRSLCALSFCSLSKHLWCQQYSKHAKISEMSP